MSLDAAQTSMRITLTDEEEKLLAGIELEALSLKDHVHAQENAEAVFTLMSLLVGRKGIPAIRAAYFSDPEHNAGGRGRSIQDLFKRNGIGRREVLFRHPHFLAHLRYFIYGPQLPSAAIETFRAAVADCGMVTSGDAVPLAKSARALARQHHLPALEAADEFYKLALELGLGTTHASAIRENLKKMR